jgi:hypothetical protein
MVVVDSRIDAVQVYRSGATVTRTLELSLDDGVVPDAVEVRPLPLSLYDATVRMKVLACEPAGTSLVATATRVGLYPRSHDDAPEPPDDEARKDAERRLERELRRLEDVLTESAQLAHIYVPDRPEGEEGKPPPASPMSARSTLEQFAEDAIGERVREKREIEERVRKLEREVAELRDREQRASAARRVKPGDLAKTVVAQLSADGTAPKKATLVLEYFVPGARWAPAYQCHLSRDGLDAKVQMRAVVAHRSGEDWRGVKLKLSTAAPMRWTELPELSSIRIGKAQATGGGKRGFRPPPRGAAELFADFDRGRQTVAGLLPRAASWSPPHLPRLALGAASGSMDALHHPPQAALGGVAPPPPAPRSPRRAKKSRSNASFEDEITSELALAAEAAPEPYYDEDEDLEMEDLALEDADLFEASTDSEMRSMAAGAPAMAKEARGAPRPRAGREAAVEAVLFTELRLGGADDPAWRNRLRPVDRQAAYLEVLARAKLEVSFDVMTVVRAAETEATAVANLPLPDGAVDVGRVSGSYDFVYEADAGVDVPADGTFHSIALHTLQAEADLRYVIVPREDTNAYRVAMLKGPGAVPLLAGPAEIYVGGEYVLTTRLPTVAPGGEFRLGLGVEQAIKCARNARFEERRADSRVGMAELDHTIHIELVNHLARTIRCEVRERIPQPAPGAEVVVEEGKVAPAWESYYQDERGTPITGGRRWEVDVEAGSQANLEARYVVKIYGNNELVGGNRREA